MLNDWLYRWYLLSNHAYLLVEPWTCFLFFFELCLLSPNSFGSKKHKTLNPKLVFLFCEALFCSHLSIFTCQCRWIRSKKKTNVSTRKLNIRICVRLVAREEFFFFFFFMSVFSCCVVLSFARQCFGVISARAISCSFRASRSCNVMYMLTSRSSSSSLCY